MEKPLPNIIFVNGFPGANSNSEIIDQLKNVGDVSVFNYRTKARNFRLKDVPSELSIFIEKKHKENSNMKIVSFCMGSFFHRMVTENFRNTEISNYLISPLFDIKEYREHHSAGENSYQKIIIKAEEMFNSCRKQIHQDWIGMEESTSFCPVKTNNSVRILYASKDRVIPPKSLKKLKVKTHIKTYAANSECHYFGDNKLDLLNFIRLIS